MIKINMEKAREIKRDLLRIERKPKLEELDVLALRNLSDPDKLKEIEESKQRLRDAPSHVLLDQTESPQALALITLSDLIS